VAYFHFYSSKKIAKTFIFTQVAYASWILCKTLYGNDVIYESNSDNFDNWRQTAKERFV